MKPHEEKVLSECLHDMANRLIASNKIVLQLAKMDPGPETAGIILQARRYVLAHMTSAVGVRKMAREKWGMVLIEKEKVSKNG